MKLELSMGWLIALGIFAAAATVGGILEVYYQTTTSGELNILNSAGDDVTGSPFSGAKIDSTTGKGQGLFAGGLLALIGGALILIALVVAGFMQHHRQGYKEVDGKSVN